MRKSWILFVLSIFLVLVGLYLLQQLNPFNQDALLKLVQSQKVTTDVELNLMVQDLQSKGLILDYLNWNNLTVLITVFSLAMFFMFVFLHLWIDKIFFKKFFLQPRLSWAIRRGLIFVFTIITLLFLKLYATEWYLYVLVVTLSVVLEILLYKVFYASQPAKVDEQTARNADAIEPQA